MIKEPALLTIRKNFPRPSEEQVAAFKDIPTGFICDALDGQAAMNSSVKPIGGGRDIECVATGVAVVAENGPAEILATMGAIHIIQPGDIIVSAVHGHTNCAAAGDRFCGMLKNKGAAGFVTDGEMRDYVGIVEVGLPAWCAGLNPNSPYSKGPGRVGFGAVVAGRYVESGDIIVADGDGVAVVPFARIDEIIAKLESIKALEYELDAKVQSGYCEMPAIEEMIADGRAVVVD